MQNPRKSSGGGFFDLTGGSANRVSLRGHEGGRPKIGRMLRLQHRSSKGTVTVAKSHGNNTKMEEENTKAAGTDRGTNRRGILAPERILLH